MISILKGKGAAFQSPSSACVIGVVYRVSPCSAEQAGSEHARR